MGPLLQFFEKQGNASNNNIHIIMEVNSKSHEQQLYYNKVHNASKSCTLDI